MSFEIEGARLGRTMLDPVLVLRDAAGKVLKSASGVPLQLPPAYSVSVTPAMRPSVGVASAVRTPQAPEVPTFAELGYPLPLQIFFGLAGPARLPHSGHCSRSHSPMPKIQISSTCSRMTSRIAAILRGVSRSTSFSLKVFLFPLT